MAKPDTGHILTEKELRELERRIAALYKEARDSLDETVKAYFESFRKRDEAQKAKLDAGEITKEQYTQWRLNQIGRGERFKALRETMAERYTKANEVAVSYVNDDTPGIYSLNRNYAAYTIEKTGADVSFTLFDEQTVKRLMVEAPELMPYYPAARALKRGIDLKYGKKQITASVTSGILQGKSIGKIANDLQSRMETMNRSSAIRTARTAVTGAQNAGRQDSYVAAEKMGIEMEREWLATLDNRTRHAHAVLDGQRRPINKPFQVDGQEIMFPGDPKAKPYLVYNCRCSLVAAPKGVNFRNSKRRAIDPKTGKSVLISNMTYSEWEAWHKSNDPDAWDVFIKKGKNISSDQKQYEEYKKLLGKNVPQRFDDFQNLKYNDPEKWAYTKRFASYKRKYPTSTKRYFDVQEELRESGVLRGVVLPPVQKQAFILPEGSRDPYHIMHRMVERSLTDDDIRGYMKDAKIMLVQWGGKRQMFVGQNGVCIITKSGDDWIYKTAWDKSDYDEDTDKIMEAIKHARL